jgi:U3 small nucleolar RNA-associated protein 15
MKLEHGAPIESLAWFPSAGLLATAGGPMVCVWDALTGRRLQRLTNHQKTVMCVRVAADIGPPSRGPADAHVTATRMFTGSLDGHLKVYDCDLFKVTHVSKYPGPITSLAVAPDCSALAVGTANGLLSIRRRSKPRDAGVEGAGAAAAGAGKQPKARRPPRMMTGVYRYFMRGQSSKAGASDLKVAAQRRAHLAPFDRKLRSFRLGDALDAALHTHRPEVVVSVLEELLGRGGLQSAVSGRHAEALCPILDFLAKCVAPSRTIPIARVPTHSCYGLGRRIVPQRSTLWAVLYSHWRSARLDEPELASHKHE